MLSALGETINIMTLGGLALAVGILVDDATVEIENINRNLEEGKEIEQAILDGAAQIASPGLRLHAFHLHRVRAHVLSGRRGEVLFVPLAEAVVFAMLASYLLSRTVVPTMAKYLLAEHDPEAREQKQRAAAIRSLVSSLRSSGASNSSAASITACSNWPWHHSTVFLILFVVFCVGSFALLYPWLGQDFFPSVDAGQFKLHVRARTGTRIEETARLCDQIDNAIRREIPARRAGHHHRQHRDSLLRPQPLLHQLRRRSGSADADITVSLTERSPAHRCVRRGAALKAGPGVSRRYVLFAAGGHGRRRS